VNPVVAIILGWAILHEPITPRILAAAAIIIGGVVMITALPHLLDRSRLPASSSSF
jgi:drug/metabolite transporter (DMT)-like permease